MPFTSPEDQLKVAENGNKPITVGDMCREHYVPLIHAWRKSRRWTTAHNLAKNLFDMPDDQTAKLLAFFEFYIREVHPYETEKLKQNGDIPEEVQLAGHSVEGQISPNK